MPIIQFKTIKQQAFELDVDKTATIAEVKKKISEAMGKDDFPVDGQKLIFNGKVLEDGENVPEVTQGKFIVVMVIKKPGVKPIANTQSTSNSTTTTTSSQKKGEENKEAVSAVKKPASPEQANAPATLSAEQNKTIEEIASMGHPRDEVVRACQAAFFNADRAVEYLCNGIPEGLSLAQAQAAGDGDADEDEGEDAANLAFLANSPQFQQLREMVRADPSTLPQIVQQIAETNPGLMDMIRNDQDQFLQLLNAAPRGQAGDAAAAQPAMGQGQAGNEPATGGQQRIAIPITPEDRAAINRLMAMGFPEALVIEAYIACDRNEDLAVNYILQRMEEMHG